MPIQALTMEVFWGFYTVNRQHYQRHPKIDIFPDKHVTDVSLYIVKIGPPVFAQVTAERPYTLQ